MNDIPDRIRALTKQWQALHDEDVRKLEIWQAQLVDAANFGTREQNARIEAELEVQRLRAALQLPDAVADIQFLWDWRTNQGGSFLRHSDDAVTMRLLLADIPLHDVRGFEWVKDAREAEAAAQDAAPDTSRVSFGARHEGTGMVLLQHADLPHETFGHSSVQDVAWHRRVSGVTVGIFRAAHAALAEVREALNAAETAGVDVSDRVESYQALCGVYGPLHGDDPTRSVTTRASRFLAREVQALVDQGLRGDDLNARLPYEVRDHRVQETTREEQIGDAEVRELGDQIVQAVRDYEAEGFAIGNVALNLIETFQDAHQVQEADTSSAETDAIESVLRKYHGAAAGAVADDVVRALKGVQR